MAEQVLPKHLIRVRFSLSAQYYLNRWVPAGGFCFLNKFSGFRVRAAQHSANSRVIRTEQVRRLLLTFPAISCGMPENDIIQSNSI